jgi:hypothetical protein
MNVAGPSACLFSMTEDNMAKNQATSANADIEAVLSPSGPLGVAVSDPAPRPDSLSGKRIAFLWDSMFRGDEMFPVLQEAIGDRFENVSFVEHEAFGSTFGGDEEAVLAALPGRLRELKVDAVVSGVGC